MEKIQICPPALIFVIYMTIQVVIDIFQGFYNRSFVKIVLLFLIGGGLNVLCENGYTIVAWVLVFVPFVLMSLVVVLILFLLKKKETSGDVKTKKDKEENQAPVIVIPNNYSIQPTENGCIMIVKHDLTRHGMRTVSRDMYCPTRKSSVESST
jgi:hypothetical protein